MINDLDRVAREYHRKEGCSVTAKADARCPTCKEFDSAIGWYVTPHDRKFLKSLRIEPT
jgi:hypothetical protein